MMLTWPVERIMRRDEVQYFILVAVSMLAVGVRFFRLERWSFWVDELNTLDSIQYVWLNFGANVKDALLSYPVTSTLIYAATEMLGVSEFSARLAPALVGIVSVPIFYFLVRRVFGVHAAIVAALLLAISPWHLYWSQNARFYVLLLLFSTLSLFTVYLGLEKDRPWLLALSAAFMFLAATERLLGLYLFPVVLAYLLLLKLLRYAPPRGLHRRNVLLMGGLYTAVFLLVGWLAATGMTVGDNFSEPPPRGPFSILIQQLQGVDLPVFFIAGATAVYYIWQRRSRAVLLFALSAAAPLVAVMAASTVTFAQGRYTFVSLTSWLVLAAVGISAYITDIPKRSSQIVTVLIVGLLFVLGPAEEMRDYYFRLNGGRPAWEEAFGYVRQHRQPDARVLSNDPRVAAHYFGEDVVGMNLLDAQNDPARLAQSESQLWFVVAGDSRVDPALAKWIDRHTTAAYFDGLRTWVYVYDPG